MSDNNLSAQEKIQIGIVAGEPSGDSLGAGLISALKSRSSQVCFVGVGGPKMKQAGCEILFDMDRIEAMGLDGIIGKLSDILHIRKTLHKKFCRDRPALFIGIDVPDFNLTLESRLKKRGIKTLHYVSPTVWAWRKYRIHKIRRSVDHMLTLFPFEREFYQRHQIAVTCVGHPVADQIDTPDKMAARNKLGVDVGDDEILIGLLPGSRSSEIRRLGQVFADVASTLFQQNQKLKFILPFANTKVEQLYRTLVGSLDSLPVTLLQGQSRLAIEASDVVLLASGTAALEAALLGRPHVVAYKVSTLTWLVFQTLKHVDYYSMSNHLLPEPIIPELIQNDASADKISKALTSLLQNPELMKQMESQFCDVRRRLKLDANSQAADVVMKMIQEAG